MSNGLWGLVNNSNYYVWKRVYTNLIDLIRDVFQLVYVLRDRVDESICSQRIKVVNLTPYRFSPSRLGVLMLCSCQCTFAHGQDWEKITELCTRYMSVGISETNLTTKGFGRLSITTSHIIELYAKYNKENVAVIDRFAKRWLVTNKRQMIEWIPVLSTNSIFIQCISLRDPYDSAF